MADSPGRIEFGEIRSNLAGFSALAEFASRVSKIYLDEIVIDAGKVTWFDANMCAPLGAILYVAANNLNEIRFDGFLPDVEVILSKNGFLANYGFNARKDAYGTTIQYRRFLTTDSRHFANYVERELFIGMDLPRMTDDLVKKLKESILEIFSNAVIHAESELGIFTCGQFFPKKHHVDFTIADLGMGIRENIFRNTGLEMEPSQAISWALEGRNTTKRGPIPGGLGLKLLKEFITMNDGRIQIVSDRGYWELTGGQTRTALLKHRFPGTVVNIEINTNDRKSYRLVSKLKPEDVF